MGDNEDRRNHENREEKTMKKTFAIAVLLFGLASAAWAGSVSGFGTDVNLESREASGVYLFSRKSCDNVQFIYCAVSASEGQSPLLACAARDKDSEYLACKSKNPLLLKLAGSISAYSLVSFRCYEDNTLESVWVANTSCHQ
jgi:hypothetical protein